MIQPLEQYVIVEITEHKMQKQHGILVAIEKKKGVTTEGTIIAAGPGKRLKDDSIRKMTVKVGEKVLVPNDAGIPTKLDNKQCLVIKEDDIIGVIE